MDNQQYQPPARARIHSRRLISPVWIVPVIAGLIAAYLGWQSYAKQGPIITLTFNSAEGLAVGQTQLRYKAVSLGNVTDITLDPKLQHVIVKAKMTRAAEPLLTDKARFWIVRPRLSAGNFSGIETLVSGSYIQCDPGISGGKSETSFAGLEDPPAVRSDEPGTTFKLQAHRLGSIGRGSPVYYRDINVGEVLSYDIGDGFGLINLNVFVRSPYDKLVSKNSHFWNTSSLSVDIGPTGLQVQLQSIQALLSGGVTFFTPNEDKTPVEKDQVFTLFRTKQEADISALKPPIQFVSYFDSSVKNIGPGSPVYIYGIQVGEVNDVKLIMDYDKASVKVQVHFQVQPERAFVQSSLDKLDPKEVTDHLISKGLRVKIDGGGIIPGQGGLSFDFNPKAPSAEFALEGDVIVMPAEVGGGGLEGIESALADITAKLNRVPIEQIGDNLNSFVGNANSTVKNLDQNSDFQRDTKRTLDQVNDAARSIRLLADFLSQHPESLIRGRTVKDKE